MSRRQTLKQTFLFLIIGVSALGTFPYKYSNLLPLCLFKVPLKQVSLCVFCQCGIVHVAELNEIHF
jgi:hypothetical protein